MRGALAVAALGVMGAAAAGACASGEGASGGDGAGDGSVLDGGGDAAAAGDAGPADAPGRDHDGAARDAPADVRAEAAPDPIGNTLVGTDVPAARVGILYSVWHTPASTVQRGIAAEGGAPLSMEDVLRSGGALTYADIYQRYAGAESAAMSLYYMVTPTLGYYCLYQAPDGGAGLVPDCPDVAATLATHAEQLIAAGVDHVVVDATNLSADDAPGLLLQLRPTQVLFAGWAALRASGHKTPQIAVWNAVPTGAVQWQDYLALYDDPAYEGLVMHDKATGKKVFFAVDAAGGNAPDAALLSQIRSNGGRNDVEVQRMWTLAKTDPTVDRWAFMSFCQAGGSSTTTLAGAATCDQPYTPAATLGSQVAVSPAYQTGYGSLPWGSPGKLRGLTFRLEWATALAVMPGTVFVSGWNELVAQPQPNPYAGDPFARSVGLERDPGGANLFVDTYGAEFGRDVEPTVQYGTAYYDLLASCARVYRSNADAGSTGCHVAGEACCDTSGAATFVDVYALRDGAAADSLLTTSAAERATLLAAGGWSEVCARYGTPGAFCVNPAEPSTPFGPFAALGAPGPGLQALYRCIAGARHFDSLSPTCEGQTVESVLAYVATAPSSETPRRLERCYFATTGEHVEALGVGCPAGAADEGALGYVR